MLVKLIHNLRSTVHDGVGLVLGIVGNSVTGKAANLMLVDKICGFFVVNVGVSLDGTDV